MALTVHAMQDVAYRNGVPRFQSQLALYTTDQPVEVAFDSCGAAHSVLLSTYLDDGTRVAGNRLVLRPEGG